MKLVEIFEYQAQSPKWAESEDNVFVSFYIDDNEYHISMFAKDSTTWDVSFALVIDDGDDYEYGMSGTGHEIKVFSAVVNILKQFVSKYAPLAIEFSADTTNRQSLYNTIVRKVFPGWEVNPLDDKFVAIKK